MDEEYGAHLLELVRQERQKPPEERDPQIMEDWRNLVFWYRQLWGLPAKSPEEEAWRESFNYHL